MNRFYGDNEERLRLMSRRFKRSLVWPAVHAKQGMEEGRTLKVFLRPRQ
jgi:hypothetical protein